MLVEYTCPDGHVFAVEEPSTGAVLVCPVWESTINRSLERTSSWK